MMGVKPNKKVNILAMELLNNLKSIRYIKLIFRKWKIIINSLPFASFSPNIRYVNAVNPWSRGNSSITFEQEMYLLGSNKLIATGEIIWVNTNQDEMKPVNIPDILRNLLKEYQD